MTLTRGGELIWMGVCLVVTPKLLVHSWNTTRGGGRREGREEGEEWDGSVQSESGMYRYLLRHHKMPEL